MTTAFAQRKRSLDATPVRNPRLLVQKETNSRVALVAPREMTKRPRWQRMLFLLPGPREHTVELDQIGSLVWSLCDGSRSVREVILAVADRYQFARREAEVSVLAYFRSLGKRGFVGMKMGEEDD